MRNIINILIIYIALVSSPVYADDTELFVKTLTLNPQVLIIFDTSGSMAYNQVEDDPQQRTRLAVAKEAVTSLIADTPDVDFGLVVFNYDNGGHITDRIKSRNASQITALQQKINGLQGTNWTPLCETYYEAYLYYTGQSVNYGLEENNRDKLAENNEVYISPLEECHETVYVILMTDGKPYRDDESDDDIKDKTGATAPIHGSYLPHLAGYLNDNDFVADGSKQHIVTYTIGFGADDVTSDEHEPTKMLKETAKLGGGKYFSAVNATQLSEAFNSAVFDILESAASLSSPAVAINSFDRTQSLNDLYYSMFSPSESGIWRGNLKKLKINDAGIIVDKNGESAIDDNGVIKETATTYWSSANDGPLVTKGGVGEMLATITSRNVISNLQPTNSTLLSDVNKINLKTGFDVTTDANLAAELGIATNKLSDGINWLIGLDVNDSDDDGIFTDNRIDIFADPLHSSPATISYVDSSGNTTQRLLIGTNAGFVHMFTDNDTTVSEDWAFIPKDLIAYGIQLIDGGVDGEHSYGMDLSPVIINHIKSNGDLQIIAVIGMRRGGSSYYALDITTASAPKLLWQIKATDTDFTELAQTWSVPSIGEVRIGAGSTITDTPVLVFGGGYDTNKDTCTPTSNITCDDTKGRAIFMVNALTGEYIWSAEPTAGGCANDDLHCIRDSIAAPATLLDSDYDGYTDRIYIGDTGGNIWRADLHGTDTSLWSHIKLAALGGDSESTDRRFFSAPVIARTYADKVTSVTGGYAYSTIPYDGVLMGTGNRVKPSSDLTTDNYFFNIHDYNINPTLFGEDIDKPTTVRQIDDLFDMTANPIGNAAAGTVNDLYVDMGAKQGWRYQLRESGEKIFGKATLLNGTIYFASFSPEFVNTACGISPVGQGWLYAINIHSGLYSLPNEKTSMGARVPDDVVIYSSINEQGKNVLYILGAGAGEVIAIADPNGDPNAPLIDVNSGTIDTKQRIKHYQIYSFFEER